MSGRSTIRETFVVVVPMLEMRETHRTNTVPPTVERTRLPIVLDDAADPIEEALERNGADLTYFLWNSAKALAGPWPWAWIFSPRCYPLAGHLRSLRREKSEMPFTLYGRERDPVPPGWTPCVGAVLPMTKDVLRRAASRSPMFESAWRVLADCSAAGHCACLSDAHDPTWVETVRDRIGGTRA